MDRYGFLKTAAAIPSVRVADCAYNAGQIIALMEQAEEQHVKVLVLPELCVTGYTCGDLFLQHGLHVDHSVAQHRRLFKLKRIGGLLHLQTDLFDETFLLAGQKRGRLLHHRVIFALWHAAAARRETAPDLIVQTRSSDFAAFF